MYNLMLRMYSSQSSAARSCRPVRNFGLLFSSTHMKTAKVHLSSFIFNAMLLCCLWNPHSCHWPGENCLAVNNVARRAIGDCLALPSMTQKLPFVKLDCNLNGSKIATAV